MVPRVMNLVTHLDYVKEILLYYGKCDITRMYDLYQKTCHAKQDGRPLTDYFAAFIRAYEELNANMPIIADVKKI